MADHDTDFDQTVQVRVDRDGVQDMHSLFGSCACGGVRFELKGKVSPITICHCSQCRKFHGGPGPYISCRRERMCLLEDTTLRWYQSSPKVRRGFCGRCGCSMFFDDEGSHSIEIAAGVLDGDAELTLQAHIFASSRARWENLDDGLPRYAEQLPHRPT